MMTSNDNDPIQDKRAEFTARLKLGANSTYRDALARAPDLANVQTTFDQAAIRFECNDITPEQQAELEILLADFRPWKKGPFNFFGCEIDAEWRSDLKWDRLLPHVPDLNGKVIADIGCHNGYFMFRMLPFQPAKVIGFEPVAKHWYSFQLIQKYAKAPQLQFEGLGVEDIHHFEGQFDVVFCLGILYHHTDPVGLLRKIHTSMKTGATLVIDCQGIPGDDPLALVPRGKYCGASGIWFLPTATTLDHWLARAGFRNTEIFFNEPLSTIEQRATAWADIKSLADFLDPGNPSRTVEGYPAPHRIYAKAMR